MSWADPWMDYGWGNTPLNGNQADVKFSMLGQHTFYLDCLGPGGITYADVETHQVKSVPITKPNIIVIMTDDQDDGPTMKKMDKVDHFIAQQRITFENSFVDNSLCCPSRATFLTVQFSHNNGVFMIAPSTDVDADNTYTGGYVTLHPTADNTLPVWLQDANYTTVMIGKYINGYGSQVSG